jgi:phosphoglycerate dehydrogenase-like enzyme
MAGKDPTDAFPATPSFITCHTPPITRHPIQEWSRAMTKILLDLPIEESLFHRLRELPSVSVHMMPPHEREEAIPYELLHGARVLLCKMPPANFEEMRDLELMQLATVGYEHLRHLGLAERSLRVCHARGLFDTAIAEWALAMMINLTRDVRRMLHNQDRGVWGGPTRAFSKKSVASSSACGVMAASAGRRRGWRRRSA